MYDCSRSFSWHSWTQLQRIWTRPLRHRSLSAQLMRKAATVRNTQITLSGKTVMELALGRRPRDLLDPASMNPVQLTSTPTKQDLLKEEIQKLAMRTHLEVQQREDIRRDLAERMKFVPPDLRAGENLFLLARRCQQDPARTEIWKMVEGGNRSCQGLHGNCQYRCDHISGKRKQQRIPLDTVDLEELPDSRERAGGWFRGLE